MTQFLSLQAQSAPAGIFSSTGGSAPTPNAATTLDGSTTSSAALNVLSDETPSFANLLNAETVVLAGNQRDLVASQTASFNGEGAALFNEDQASSSLTNSQSAGTPVLVENGEDLVLNLATTVNEILPSFSSGEENNDIPADIALNGDDVISEVGLGDQALTSGSIPQILAISQPAPNGTSVTAGFGADPLIAQPGNVDPDTLDDINLSPLPAGANTQGLEGNGFANFVGTADADVLDSISRAEPLSLNDTIQNTTFGQDISIDGNAGTSASTNENIVTGGFSDGDALQQATGNLLFQGLNDTPQNIAAQSPSVPTNLSIEATTALSPLASASSTEISTAGPSVPNNIQAVVGTTSANSIEQALNSQPDTRPLVQASIENNQSGPSLQQSSTQNATQSTAQALTTDQVQAVESSQIQGLSQNNNNQIDGALLRVEQTIPRQAGVGVNGQSPLETPTINVNPQGRVLTGELPANVNQNTSAAANRIDEASINQGNVSEVNQRSNNAPANFEVDSRGATEGLRNISQIAQLLGQAGGETQLATIQNIVQSTPQLNASGQPATYTPQASTQFTPAFLSDETLPTLSAQLSRGLVGGRDSFNIQLNPSELGRVDVRFFTNDDGSVNARVLVERVETLDLFQRDVRALERSLQQSGIKLSQEGIDLSLKDNGANGGGNNAASNGDFTGNEGQRDNENSQRLEEEGTRTLSERLLVEDIGANVPGDVIQTIYARFTPGQLNIEV